MKRVRGGVYRSWDGNMRKEGWKRSDFFFSSRRRHTRFTSDWSSDVCSSDLTHEFTIHDAPFDNEIVIAIGGASSGRAHARTGDRYQDMKEMGIEHK